MRAQLAAAGTPSESVMQAAEKVRPVACAWAPIYYACISSWHTDGTLLVCIG